MSITFCDIDFPYFYQKLGVEGLKCLNSLAMISNVGHSTGNYLINLLFLESVHKPRVYTIFLAEILGTALLMYLGCMGTVRSIVDLPVIPHFPGISFGLTVLLVIQVSNLSLPTIRMLENTRWCYVNTKI